MPTSLVRGPDHTPAHDLRRAILSGEISSYATVYVGILCQHFGGTEWFGWEPDVVYQEVLDDLGVDMPLVVRDGLWGLVSALTTDRFYHDAMFFNHVAQALGGGPVTMDHFEPAEPLDMAWAVLEVGMNDSDNDDQIQFGPEVRTYVGAILHRENLGKVVPLEFATMPPKGLSDEPTALAATVQDQEDQQRLLEQHLQQRLRELRGQLTSVGVLRAGARGGARPR